MVYYWKFINLFLIFYSLPLHWYLCSSLCAVYWPSFIRFFGCVFVCSDIGRVGSWLTYVDTFTRASVRLAVFAFCSQTFFPFFCFFLRRDSVLETRFRCATKWYWLWTGLFETFAKLFFCCLPDGVLDEFAFFVAWLIGNCTALCIGEFYNRFRRLGVYYKLLTYETVWASCVVCFFIATFGTG